jgi:hypothetical protein
LSKVCNARQQPTPATLAAANPGTICPPAPHRAVSPSFMARKRHKMLQHFSRAIPRANGIARASTPPGSLGNSPTAIIRSVGDFPR